MSTEVTRPISSWQRFYLRTERDRPGYVTGPWNTMNAVVELRGPLDVDRLDRAFRDLVARHDLLRSRIDLDAGVHVVRSAVATGLEVVEDDENGRRHAPVGFDAPSPVRLRLARVEPDRHVLCLHLHHVMADPGTLWILLDELAALYRGAVSPPRAQYWEFADTEARLTSPARAAAEAWWDAAVGEHVFASAAPGTGPPFARRETVLDAPALAAMARFTRSERATPLVSLLAAVACAMEPYLGAGDRLLFLTHFTRRDRPRWRALPGPCMGAVHLPLPRPPARLSGDYARSVRDVVVGARLHSPLPVRDVMARHPALAAASSVPLVQYLPDERPATLVFGDATGTVVDAAGAEEKGKPPRPLGIRARRTAEGELAAHVSGDGVGWTEERVTAVCRRLHWAAERHTSGVR